MNNSYDPWDDGNLVCKPGQNAEGFELPCLFLTRVFPIFSLLLALWFLVIAKMELNLRNKTGNRSDVTRSSSHSNGRKSKADISHGVKVALALGVYGVGSSFAWIISGHGTMHPTTSVLGLAGDLCGE